MQSDQDQSEQQLQPQLQPEWSADDQMFMQAALQEAELAQLQREVPVGCVIVRDGSIIARGHNMTHGVMCAANACCPDLGTSCCMLPVCTGHKACRV
jgi:tRNA(Arg) A34 adenosine deaminase TadA